MPFSASALGVDFVGRGQQTGRPLRPRSFSQAAHPSKASFVRGIRNICPVLAEMPSIALFTRCLL